MERLFSHVCPHCMKAANSPNRDTAPDGWSLHFLKDCCTPIFHCPGCTAKEAEDKARWVAAWSDPEATRKHDDYPSFLAALLALGKVTGYFGHDDTPESIDSENWLESFNDGSSPAQAMSDDMAEGC